ncbi:hypothetical protein ACDX31_27160, partial [Klebsiella quasipneumoniae]|uniref:hypothetical protein n=1 Tax=Klebsiella quasipneumoniae TaxID=1463165 RepID=UPI0035572DEC
MTTEAPKWRWNRADQYVAGAGKLLKTWRPVIVLIMVIFQEDTCLLSVSHAARENVLFIGVLPPKSANTSTAHQRRAQAPRTVNPYLATDRIIKLCYKYIVFFFFFAFSMVIRFTCMFVC